MVSKQGQLWMLTKTRMRKRLIVQMQTTKKSEGRAGGDALNMNSTMTAGQLQLSKMPAQARPAALRMHPDLKVREQ